MKIECYISVGCGSETELRENLSKAIRDTSPRAEVVFRRISDEEAGKMGLRGSPSVLIDGKDIQPSISAGFA